MPPKDKRGRIMRRLRDMSIRPTRSEYRPPPREQCYNDKFTIWPTGQLNDLHVIVVRLSVYRGFVVDFSINQTYLVDGTPRDVARIDCCHRRVHRHQFDQDGTDLLRGEPICEIPADSGWEVVHKHYSSSLDLMDDEWEENFRRWTGESS